MRAPKQPTTEPCNLANDPFETTDVAAQHPDVVKRLKKIAGAQHTKASLWPIRALDNHLTTNQKRRPS